MLKRGILSNKKAQGDIESYFVLIRIVIATAAVLMMGIYVGSIATDTFFDKFYFSRDIALTANTVYFAPGNLYHIYERNRLNKFGIDFHNQNVKMVEGSETNEYMYGARNKILTFDYGYASDLDYNFKKEAVTKSKSIVFQKLPGHIEVGKEPEKRLKLIKCLDIDTRDPNWEQKPFLIDPGHDSNTGVMNEDIKEGNLVAFIGYSLLNKLKNVETTRKGTELNTQVRKDLAEIKSLIQKSEVIISLHVGDYPSNNNLKVYVSPMGDDELVKKREKLACLVINEILSDRELNPIFTGGNVIKVNPRYLQDDYEQVLSNDKLSLLIEIGNIQSDKIKKINKGEIKTRISDGIYLGIKRNFEGFGDS